MPLNVLAANGPYPIDWGTITEEELENLEQMSLISVVNYSFGDIGFVYPEEIKTINNTSIFYNKQTNTLTLDGYLARDCVLVLTAMGDDFKIKLKGYNELGCIVSSDLNWGGSITITGNGVLVVNQNKEFVEAVSMDVSGTGYGFFKTENTVAVKLVGYTDPETKEVHPVISVYGTKEADSSKVISLNGNVKAEPTKSEKYPMNIYEQKEVKFVDEISDDAVVFENHYTKDRNYIGFETEIGEDQVMHYDIYKVEYDETLKKNVLQAYAKNEDPVWYDLWVSDDQTMPENTVEVSSTAFSMDVCIDENGKECVFLDYSNIDKPGTDVEVYEIVNHPTYGALAIGYNPKTTYKELKIKESYTAYDHYNYSSVITTNTIVTSVPGKVTLKKAESAFGGVSVTWNAVSGAESYTVYRSQYANGKWSKWESVGSSTTTSYLDKTTKTGVQYKYTVRAKNIVGLGAYDTKGVSTTYIAAPTVKIANASNGIKVSWSKVSGATGYTVYRSEYVNGKWSGWKNMGTAKANKSSWTDKSVKSGVQYKYTVRTVSNKLKSGYKGTGALMFLSQPTVEIANAATGVNVSWNQIAGAKNYIIYRSEYNASTKKWSGWKTIGTVGEVTSHIDTTTSSGVYYKYTVRAVNGGSKGAYKASAQLLYLAQPTTKIANASNGIKVSWNKVSGATGYTVYRSEYQNGKWSSWKSMGTAKATKTSWTDKSVKDGVQYRYTVCAVNGKVKSTYKATAGLVRLQQPTVKVTAQGYDADVTWTKISNVTGYVVYRSELVDGKWVSWQNLGTQAANVTTFSDKGLESGKTYKYTVRAVNGKSLSSYKASNSVTITGDKEITKPAQ